MWEIKKYSYYNQFIAKSKFLMTAVNFNLGVAKDKDCPERTESYRIDILPQNARFDLKINGKLLSRRLNRKQSKLF